MAFSKKYCCKHYMTAFSAEVEKMKNSNGIDTSIKKLICTLKFYLQMRSAGKFNVTVVPISSSL